MFEINSTNVPPCKSVQEKTTIRRGECHYKNNIKPSHKKCKAIASLKMETEKDAEM
jgi:hypothetical protein